MVVEEAPAKPLTVLLECYTIHTGHIRGGPARNLVQHVMGVFLVLTSA